MNTTSTNGTHSHSFTPTAPELRVVFSASSPFSLAGISLLGQHTDTIIKELPTRLAYRWGFNSYERDDEIKGKGNSYDFGARMLDPRLGRFFTTDPLMNSYGFQSPYVFAGNSPIQCSDFNGEFKIEVNFQVTNGAGEVQKMTAIFRSNAPHVVKLVNNTTGETMSFKFKTRSGRRGGTSLAVMNDNYSNTIDESSTDVKEVLNAKFGEFNVTDLLTQATNSSANLNIIIIGNDGIGGLKIPSNTDRNQLVGRSYWHRKNPDGTVSESYYYEDLNDGWIIVHFDGTEEVVGSYSARKSRWFELEKQYTLERAQTVADQYFSGSGAEVKSRYTLGSPTIPINYKGMELLPASRDAVGITIGFDLTKFSKQPKKEPEPVGKAKHPRWL